MSAANPFVGRVAELTELRQAVTQAAQGHGGLVLVAGEAGIGKTRYAREALNDGLLRTIECSASPSDSSPFGLVVTALRAVQRAQPHAPAQWGPLVDHLALLLPELGPPPETTDQASLESALCDALTSVARSCPTALLLDDLQWADSATVRLLPTLAGRGETEPLLVIGTYRDVGLPRRHELRAVRAALRRQDRLREVHLPPLTMDESAGIATGVLGRQLSAADLTALHERAQGLPFFVEELAEACKHAARDSTERDISTKVGPPTIPLPATVREAILLRVAPLSEAAQEALNVAAVVGRDVDLDLIGGIVDDPEGIDAALTSGVLRDLNDGRATFRHALVQETLYREIPWNRRRDLHRRIAGYLESHGTTSSEIAWHWLAAREHTSARLALLQAAEQACAGHAYRDAARAAQCALEIWPMGEDQARRLRLLEHLGECAALTGDSVTAVRAWQEAADGHRAASCWTKLAEVERLLAGYYALIGDRRAGLRARQAAAEAFELASKPAEAAAERLAAVEHLEGLAAFTAGLDLVRDVVRRVDRLNRPDLLSRARALEGQILADLGQIQIGLETIRLGLSLALESNLVEVAADAYYRLANAMSQSSDYAASRQAYHTAISFCETNGAPAMQLICLGCLAVVLRQTGEWDQGITVCRDVLSAPDAPAPARAIATGMLGSFQAFRGERARARVLLNDAHAQSQRIGIAALELDTSWNLALLDEQEQAPGAAVNQYRFILERWASTDDRHYAIAPLCSAVTFFAGAHAETDARACTHALATVAADTGNPEALAGAALALGECAWMEADAGRAVREFRRALELLNHLDVPYERARLQLRAGMALAASGERAAAVEHLIASYRTAQRLGARPLAMSVAQELTALGEPIHQRLGRRAANYLKRGGLSSRELEVLRLVCQGRTSKEIATALFLSPRTVEMYVSNILGKLNCSTRAEATHRAHELGLLSVS
ncbi:MAG: helix-turn-helix transcriptional regulator [Chloroflexota bacterium]